MTTPKRLNESPGCARARRLARGNDALQRRLLALLKPLLPKDDNRLIQRRIRMLYALADSATPDEADALLLRIGEFEDAVWSQNTDELWRFFRCELATSTRDEFRRRLRRRAAYRTYPPVRSVPDTRSPLTADRETHEKNKSTKDRGTREKNKSTKDRGFRPDPLPDLYVEDTTKPTKPTKPVWPQIKISPDEFIKIAKRAYDALRRRGAGGTKQAKELIKAIKDIEEEIENFRLLFKATKVRGDFNKYFLVGAGGILTLKKDLYYVAIRGAISNFFNSYLWLKLKGEFRALAKKLKVSSPAAVAKPQQLKRKSKQQIKRERVERLKENQRKGKLHEENEVCPRVYEEYLYYAEHVPVVGYKDKHKTKLHSGPAAIVDCIGADDPRKKTGHLCLYEAKSSGRPDLSNKGIERRRAQKIHYPAIQEFGGLVTQDTEWIKRPRGSRYRMIKAGHPIKKGSLKIITPGTLKRIGKCYSNPK